MKSVNGTGHTEIMLNLECTCPYCGHDVFPSEECVDNTAVEKCHVCNKSFYVRIDKEDIEDDENILDLFY